ncbi:nad-dependent malic enzyme 2 [Quercus suber]|uniref:Nad-dependent malic enzyme 2 n=1 Tax=Quercus suber TaxID=58331 RepID=A0AAW0IVS3_QUESU
MQGLVTKERKELDPSAAPFAKDPREIEGLREGAGLVEVVKKVKPHVLLGLSGVGGVFNEECLTGKYVLRLEGEDYLSIVDEFMEAVFTRWPKAIVQFEDFQMKWAFETLQRYRKRFCMFNDDIQGTAGVALAGLLGSVRAKVDHSECTAADAFRHAGENIVFASGSPFENVDLGNGKVGHVNQANNMYLFPGIGLGTLLSGARFITDGMLQAASECLASYMTDEDIQNGILYPSINSIRNITAEVGAAVLRAAVAEELAEGHCDVGPKELKNMSKEMTVEYVRSNMWFPVYSPLVHEK